MKLHTFKLSTLVGAMLTSMGIALDKVTQACEAFQNGRTVTRTESNGTSNVVKSGRAESEVTIALDAKTSIVSVFIEYAESEVGAFDKLSARAEKLGATIKCTSIPKYKGHDLAQWVTEKFGTNTAKAPKARKPKAEKPAPVTTEPAKTEPAPVVA